MTAIAFTTFAVMLKASMAVSATPTYTEALKTASETGKPLLILVGADWCHYCNIVKKDILPKLEKSGLLDQVVFCYLDYDQDRRLVGKLVKGEIIPEMILFNKTDDGWKANHLIGSYKLDEIERFIKSALPATAPVAAKP
jgi:thioredoxin-like negative regulator of GroEL